MNTDNINIVVPAIVKQQEQIKPHFLSIWKQLAHEKKLTRYDMAFYCLSKALRSKEDHLKEAKRYLSKAFTPATKPKQLASGRKPYGTLWDALWWNQANYDLRCSLPEEELKEIQELAKAIRGFKYGEVDLL
jgi:hypothetical protein